MTHPPRSASATAAAPPTRCELPPHGRPADELLAALEQRRAADVRWQTGRAFALVFHGGDDVAALAQQAYLAYFSENALNPGAFPSLRTMEIEVVQMVAGLLHGDAEVCGNMTSGGTESILMAVKTARDGGRLPGAPRRRGRGRARILVPESAHPAFDKAAHYFGVAIDKVPVGPDLRADVAAMARALRPEHVLIVGSAPSYPHGVVDPIADIAALAQRHGLRCHVDACVGGLLLPFVHAAGRHIRPWDFAVPGVTSISADLHKFGYAAKGASVLLHRTPALRRPQYFATTDWNGGLYASPSMTGTRPGGAIAAAWAVMQHLGHAGYLRLTTQALAAFDRIERAVEATEGLEVLGRPDATLLAIAGRGIDVYEVADELQARGWHLDRQQRPPSLHLTVSAIHGLPGVSEAFVADLQAAAAAVRARRVQHALGRARDATIRGVLGVLPGPLASAITQRAAAAFGLGDGGLPQRAAPMYGMMAALPNRGDVKQLVIDALDRLTR